jgi:hypothetical protein
MILASRTLVRELESSASLRIPAMGVFEISRMLRTAPCAAMPAPRIMSSPSSGKTADGAIPMSA